MSKIFIYIWRQISIHSQNAARNCQTTIDCCKTGNWHLAFCQQLPHNISHTFIMHTMSVFVCCCCIVLCNMGKQQQPMRIWARRGTTHDPTDSPSTKTCAHTCILLFVMRKNTHTRWAPLTQPNRQHQVQQGCTRSSLLARAGCFFAKLNV